MKPNRTKCTWAACIAALAVCMTVTVPADPPSAVPIPPSPNNFGSGYISSVTSTGSCVRSTTNGGGIQFWDIQAGGTYTVTLSDVTDCANGGNDYQIGVVVHNSAGGNIYVVATQQSVGVYSFTIPLTTQCLTMPIEYCTHDSDGLPANQPGSGIFAQDFVNGAPGGHEGHLRTATFDDSCNVTGEDTTCQSTPPPVASISACKYYDKNTNGTQDAGEPALTGWPFCIDPLDNAIPQLATQTGGNGGCVTWMNLTPGSYQVREADTHETNWVHSSPASEIVAIEAGQTKTVRFGNYCTAPSGGLTLGFWSNKNGNKILTGSPTGTGTNLLPAVTQLLNSPCGGGYVLVNAGGTRHNFTGTYADLRTWLLSATATNMAYMLSVQLATLELDVNFGVPPNKVDGNAFDLCSHLTVNSLMSAACDTLRDNPYTISGDPSRLAQQTLKDCIDKINNNGDVVPATPCSYTFPTPPAPCP